MTASDVDDTSLTYTVVAQAAHGTVTLNQDGSFSYAPESGYNGSDSFTYKVNDGTLDSNVATVNLTIIANDPPVAADGAASGDEDTTITGAVTASDVDSDALNTILVAQAAHGTVTLNTDGSFSYMPDGEYSGSDSFTLKANDGSRDSNVATVNLTINAVNDAPVAQDGSASGNAGAAIHGNVLATDVDGPSLIYLHVAQAQHGSVVIGADGSYIYTPDAGFSGSDSFTYKASDGTRDSNVATVSVTVNVLAPPTNHAPVNTLPGTLEIEANTNTAIAGLSVSDPDAGAGTLTTTLSVAHGTLTVASAGGAAVVGSGTAAVTLTGTLAAINATLGAANNVVYRGAHDFFGADTLTMVTNDGGNGGSGGALDRRRSGHDSTQHALTGTPGDDSFTALPGNERIDGARRHRHRSRSASARPTRRSARSATGDHRRAVEPHGADRLRDLRVHRRHRGQQRRRRAGRRPVLLCASTTTCGTRMPMPTRTITRSAGTRAAIRTRSSRPPIYLVGQSGREGGGRRSAARISIRPAGTRAASSLDFDPRQYLAANPDVAAAHVDPLAHFLAVRRGRRAASRSPLTRCSPPTASIIVYYLQHNPDVAAAGVDPLAHFETSAGRRGAIRTRCSTSTAISRPMPTWRRRDINPLDHYNQFGWHEGRDPSVGVRHDRLSGGLSRRGGRARQSAARISSSSASTRAARRSRTACGGNSAPGRTRSGGTRMPPLGCPGAPGSDPVSPSGQSLDLVDLDRFHPPLR